MKNSNNFGTITKKYDAMKIMMCMIYREVLKKRLARKKEELTILETKVSVESLVTPIEKRKYIEVKAVVQELENCLDMAETMFKFHDENHI